MTESTTTFQQALLEGIPKYLPEKQPYPSDVGTAPVRKKILSKIEKQLAIQNALRYFPKDWHEVLAKEFVEELKQTGRIYMYRFKPAYYAMYAHAIDDYPAVSRQAAAIMLMIQNNLDPQVAQHPMELITYGSNGAVFQNWAQYLLTMQYLCHLTDKQTLHLYSGHPMGIFPSSSSAPRVVITNGMMVPNYSKQDDLEKFNALGVTQYGQMTAGSFMYIGPQGIVHGTTITLMNAFRAISKKKQRPIGKVFVSSGLGGMSGAQAKAGNIVGCISVISEINKVVAKKRHQQGWVDELIDDIHQLCERIKRAKKEQSTVSIAFIGNVVEVWESFFENDIYIDIGSDQTSLHNPYAGGYYPIGLSYEQSNQLMGSEPNKFKAYVQESLRRQVNAINQHTKRGTSFFDYGNAFLLEASRAQADIMNEDKSAFRYPSYMQSILGPNYFDYGFGPFRWICASGEKKDLLVSDTIAAKVLEDMLQTSPPEVQEQLKDNLHWIRTADKNSLVVGSKARILYADAEGRINIALAFNNAIKEGTISAPIVLGRDHHDVSGTDSPFRETSNIYDGSQFTADMATHNVIGDSFRGATWVSLHNGGGVGWGEVINGGFGLLLDGTKEAETRLKSMLFFDVNNGIARRAWARNEEALFAINREMKRTPSLKVTIPSIVSDTVINKLDI